MYHTFEHIKDNSYKKIIEFVCNRVKEDQERNENASKVFAPLSNREEEKSLL